MGLNAHGLFVGLTNRASELRRDDRRSRGLLVQDALRRSKAADVASEMRQGLEAAYNPYHLFYADGERAFLTVSAEDRFETTELDAGIHVICNRDVDDPASRKASRIRAAVEQIDTRRSAGRVLVALAGVLRSHESAEPRESACVHGDEYGTRSSTLISMGDRTWRYWQSDGPACEAKYVNFSRLLDGFPATHDDRRDLTADD